LKHGLLLVRDFVEVEFEWLHLPKVWARLDGKPASVEGDFLHPSSREGVNDDARLAWQEGVLRQHQGVHVNPHPHNT